MKLVFMGMCPPIKIVLFDEGRLAFLITCISFMSCIQVKNKLHYPCIGWHAERD